MKRHDDEYNEAWFAKLDAIARGDETPSEDDDELLQVAAKLSQVLSPLTQSSYTPDLPDLHFIRNRSRRPVFLSPRTRSWLAVAVVFFVLFGVVQAYMLAQHLSTSPQNVGQQIWQTATSFEQIDASSVALQAVKRSGVRPLLPSTVPANTQSIEFGIITDGTNAQNFIAFAADYRIAERDVSVYEQAANLVAIAPVAAQIIMVGTSRGYLFQDHAGNSILQWYQDGMTCQIASVIPVSELLALAHQFHPIPNWEYII